MRSKLAALAVCLAASLAGCRSATVGQSVVTTLEKDHRASQVEFWHTLAQRPVTDNDDAFHGLLLFFDGRDDSPDYTARVRSLKAKGLLPAGFDRPANQAVRRGDLAVAFVKGFHFLGGLNMRLFGVTPRWAIAELEFRGLFPPSSDFQTFAGIEFLGVIAKMQDFRAGDPSTYPPDLLPSKIRQSAVAQMVPDSEPDDSISLDLLDPAEISLLPPIFASMLQDAGPAPATRPGEIVATIVELEGSVNYKPRNGDLIPAKIGVKIAPGESLHTGLDGAVRLTIPPDQELAVDGLSNVSIVESTEKNGKITTRIQMQNGRSRYRILSPGLDHDCTIITPTSSLIIRGTIVTVYDQPPFPPAALSLTGRAQYSVDKRRPVPLGSKNGRLAAIRGGQTAAQTAQSAAIVDPFLPSARTLAEQPLIDSVISRGGAITFDTQSNIRVITGGGSPTTPQLIRTLPGQLNFVARWDTNANIDLSVATPNGDFLYPAGGLDHGKGGGVVPFDHRGGKGGGFEIVYFPAGKVIPGIYTVSAVSISGQQTNLTLEAYYNKRPINLSVTPPFDLFHDSRTVGPTFGITDAVLVDPSNLNFEPAAQRAQHKQPRAAALSVSTAVPSRQR